MRVLLGVIAGFLTSTAQAADLTVQVKNVRSGGGKLLMSVYDRADGFPDKPEKAVRIERRQARRGNMTVGFTGLPAGEYAVVFIHDENDNGEMDIGNFNIPKEGLGFSNDPRLTFGPPSFSQARFHIGEPETSISATMKYY